LKQGIEHIAISVNCPPQPVLLAVNRDAQFIVLLQKLD